MTTPKDVINDIADFFQNGEQYVQNIILNIQQAVEVAETDLRAALVWVNSHAAEVANDIAKTVTAIEQSISVLSAVGVTLPPQVQIAVQGANAAVAGLNAYIAANANSAGTEQAVVQGYIAAKTALAHTSAAAAAIATAAVPNPVIAPAQ